MPVAVWAPPYCNTPHFPTLVKGEHWLSVTWHPPGDALEMMIESMEYIKIPDKLSASNLVFLVKDIFERLIKNEKSNFYKCKLRNIKMVEDRDKLVTRQIKLFTSCHTEMMRELMKVLCRGKILKIPAWRSIDDE